MHSLASSANGLQAQAFANSVQSHASSALLPAAAHDSLRAWPPAGDAHICDDYYAGGNRADIDFCALLEEHAAVYHFRCGSVLCRDLVHALVHSVCQIPFVQMPH
jgi:hypothetical protein